MGKNLLKRKTVKVLSIVLAVCVGIWILYFVMYGYFMPSSYILTSPQESFTEEEIAEVDALLTQENIRYWVTYQNNCIVVTWAQHDRTLALFSEKIQWSDGNLAPERGFLPSWYFIHWNDWKFILNPVN